MRNHLTRNITRIGLGALAAIAASGLITASASAATITPTAAFVADNFTDDANCSLREAVTIANTNVNTVEPDCSVDGILGNDTIVLGGGTYVLDIAGIDGGNPNAAGDLDVDLTGNLTVDGAGAATTTIDSNLVGPTDRVFQSVGAGTLTLSDLTLTGGQAASGGGIFTTARLALERARVTLNTASAASGGGGIFSSGTTLSITDSVISENTVTLSGDGGGVIASGVSTTTITSSVFRGNTVAHTNSGSGGGLLALSTDMTITDSVFADNEVIETDAIGAPSGGGLTQVSSGNGTIRGTTFTQNKVVDGSSRVGGAIRKNGTGSLMIVNSTISGNEALGAGGDAAGAQADNSGTLTLVQVTVGPNPVGPGGTSALQRNVGPINVHGTVIETSGAADACEGAIGSLDDNVFTDTTCGPATGNDEADVDPMLGPLTDNGGPDAGAPGFLEPIPTHAPAAASTVVDHVPAADCDDELAAPLLVDQRGFIRPLDGDDADAVADCEAGSVEIAATPAVVPPVVTTAAPTPVPPKKCKKGRKLKKGKCVKKKRKKK